MRVFQKTNDIHVKCGETFGIALQVQAAGGYEWQPGPKSAMLEFVGSDFSQAQSGIGGASEQILKFRSAGKGVGTLHLICKRPWDASGSERQTVAVLIE